MYSMQLQSWQEDLVATHFWLQHR
uniref:Uncharacterized protein n=1 Tax=Anguilla anguilla TaxID=7936 RepID=A0A0E9T2B6_ANGAN